ncbi:hypothetical protein ACPA9J_22915 [Pseudomonas aeruginosa]
MLVSTLQRGKDGKIRVMARDMGQGGCPSRRRAATIGRRTGDEWVSALFLPPASTAGADGELAVWWVQDGECRARRSPRRWRRSARPGGCTCRWRR